MRGEAIGVAPLVRVNGVAPATVVEGASMFPRDRLAGFYAKRTLTGQAIALESQARAITAFVTDSFSRTTGQIVNVDGGLAEAFLR